jgi:hypothetical protein
MTIYFLIHQTFCREPRGRGTRARGGSLVRRSQQENRIIHLLTRGSDAEKIHPARDILW